MSDGLAQFDRHIDLLKNEPSEVELQESFAFFSLIQRSRTMELKMVSTLLDHTIPQIFNLNMNTINTKIIEFVQSVVGIGGLVNRIENGVKTNGTKSEAIVTYTRVLIGAFNDSLLETIVTDNIMEINELSKLVFRGKVFGVINQLVVEGKLNANEVGIFRSVDGYIFYLLSQMISIEITSSAFNKFFLLLLHFNGSSFLVIFDILFNQDKWSVFIDHYRLMKLFEQRKVLTLLFQFLQQSVLSGHLDQEKTVATASIVQSCFTKDLANVSTVDEIVHMQNKNMNSLVSILIHNNCNHKEILNSLIQVWGDAARIKQEPIVLQEHRTHLLIQFLILQESQLISSLFSDSIFLNSVSNHLSSFSNSVKTLAIIVADKACELANRDKIFLMGDLEGYEYLLDMNSYIPKPKFLDIQSAWNILDQPVVTPAEEIQDIVQSIDTLAVKERAKDSDDESSDDSDDEDDPSIVQRVKLTPPLYIRELIKYLMVDSNHPQAYDMQKLALRTGPTLIRQKANFGIELSSNSFTLLECLIGLNNNYHESNFEELRLSCVVAVLASHPEGAVNIIGMLGTGDYSLQQRISIISALSLAARDIRGFQDEVITKGYEERVFPSKKLPQKLHEKYLGLEQKKLLEHDSLRLAHLSIQDGLMQESSEEAKDQLVGGKILRISNKLKKTTSTQGQIVPKVKDYSKVISKNFYFPLVHLWHESGGIDIGHYSTILTGHYIKTLALLLHCSFAALSNNDMVREFLIITTELAKTTTSQDLQVIEGMMTGLLLICDVSDEQALIINYGDSFVFIQAWLSEIWEPIIDDRVKSLCAGGLLRLTKIFEKYQANLIDQMSSVY